MPEPRTTCLNRASFVAVLLLLAAFCVGATSVVAATADATTKGA